MTRLTLIAIPVVTALLSFVGASHASAQERPFYVGGGAGAALELDRYPTQAMVVEEFGYHFLGTTDGPFVGLSLAQSVGNDVFTFQAGPRLGWDIAVLRGPDVSVMLAPSVAAGLVVAAVTVNTAFGRVSGSDAAFDFQGAFDVKLLLLGEQLEIFLRPFAIDLFVDDGTAARWNVLAGAHYRF